MSYSNLLRDRVVVERPTVDLTTGSAITTYQPVDGIPIRANLDLQFIRKGRDPIWTPESSDTTPQLRTGVAFFLRTADVQDGDRIRWVKGGDGLFEIKRGTDMVKRPGQKHHLEVWISEIAPQIARGQR